MPNPPSRSAELRRVITLPDSAALVVGLIIGSGIFRAPASVAAHLPTAALIMSAWLIGGLLSLAGGLVAAELGTRFPRSGGQYVFLREAFGPAAAFSFGLTTFLISKPSILAGIATVFATYFSALAGLQPAAQKPLALGAILVLTFVNCLGVKSGTLTQNILTTVKTLGLAALGLLAFASGRGDWSHFSPQVPPAVSRAANTVPEPPGRISSSSPTAAESTTSTAAPGSPARPGGAPGRGTPDHSILVALALGLITILYTYDGWIDVTYTAGEVVDPRRVLPRAILWGTLLCTALYLFANAAYLYMLGPAEMPGLENVAAVALARAFGPAGGSLLAILVVVSTLGILNGSILTGVRVPYAMSRDGLLFGALGRVHPRTLSPVNALAAQGILAGLVVVLAEGFDEIASLFVSTTWFFYALTCAALLALRVRDARTGRQGETLLTAGTAAANGCSRLADRRAEGEHDRGEIPASADTTRDGAAAGEDRGGIVFPFAAPAAAIFIVVTLFTIGSDLAFSGPRVLVGVGIVVAAVPGYYLWRLVGAGTRVSP